jgi:hypothetical protein
MLIRTVSLYQSLRRAALVKEATRFKSTRDKVSDPTRNAQVIERAINNSVNVHLPQVIADSVYTAIINSSVQFELCVVTCPFRSRFNWVKTDGSRFIVRLVWN